jgi:hypothetical protein
MSAKASSFRETDVKRAVRATNAGVDIGRVDIGKDGKISIVPRELAGADEGQKPSGWDEALHLRSSLVAPT